MTVAMLVKKGNEVSDWDYVPISFSSVFSEYWQPAAAQLGLRWIPLFQGGLDVTQDDVPEILDELSRLRSHFAARLQARGDADVSSYIVGRIDLLAKALAAIEWDVDPEVSIG